MRPSPDPIRPQARRPGARTLGALAGCLFFTASIALLAPSTALAAPSFYSIPSGTMPDLSQHDGGWTNFCGPTSGADVVYFFANTIDAALAPSTQNGLITALASNMNTNGVSMPPAHQGTFDSDLRDGLDLYLESNDSNAGTSVWDTTLLGMGDPRPAGGSIDGLDLLAKSQDILAAGGAVILILDWLGSPPSDAYHQPTPPQPGLLKHAVVLAGYTSSTLTLHDPANQSSHAAGAPDVVSFSASASAWQLTIGGGSAHNAAVSGIVFVPIPEPGSALLVLAGLGLLARGRETSLHRAARDR